MTLKELESRVAALEKEVERLRAQLPTAATQRHWWHDDAGRFANDPVFDEIVRLGKEYRDSLHPDRRKKRKRAKKSPQSKKATAKPHARS
jgi:hypothetical protein